MEPAFKQAYLGELKKEVETWAHALGLNQTQALDHFEPVSRLLVRFGSFPTYASWKRKKIGDLQAQTSRDVPEPHLGDAEGKDPGPRGSSGPAKGTPIAGSTPEERGRNAFAAWKEQKLETAAYDNLAKKLSTMGRGPGDLAFVSTKGRSAGRMLISTRATEADFIAAFKEA